MDGVLLDSEPFWQDAEIQAFTGVGLDFTRDHAIETMGMRINEVVALRYEQSPWVGKSPQEVEDEIMNDVVARVGREGQPLPGVTEAVGFLRSKGVRLALASSSYEILIDAVIRRLGLSDVFEFTYSAQHEQFGKPHPAVYLTAAAKLGLDPSQCVAIEDSVNGMRSAKAAGYGCIAVPAPAVDRSQFAPADVVLPSLEHLDDEAWARLNHPQDTKG